MPTFSPWYYDMMAKGEAPQAAAFGKMMYETIQPGSVIDLGCGPGIYLHPFAERGCETYGVDVSDYAGQTLNPAVFELVDLSVPWHPVQTWNLALCIAVGMMIPPETHGTLVDNCVRASNLVFFSSAVPGQGGVDQYEGMPNSYWDLLLTQRGFVVDPRWEAIRTAIAADPVYNICGWFASNAVGLYRRKDEVVE